jgi:hypothetical protein
VSLSIVQALPRIIAQAKGFAILWCDADQRTGQPLQCDSRFDERSLKTGRLHRSPALIEGNTGILISSSGSSYISRRRRFCRWFIDEHFTTKGFIADVAIHYSPIGKPDNDHAHIMAPLRAIDPDTGEWRKTKDRADSRTAFTDNRDAELEALRANWASHVNAILEREDIDDRIDHRSHKDRGITDVQPGIHVGYVHQAIEGRNGGRSWRADLNRQIQMSNRQILERIKAAAVATYRDLANKLAPAKKTQEPAPAPIAAKPEPIKPPMPPPTIPDVEAEKRKKVALRAAWLQQGGGDGVGG